VAVDLVVLTIRSEQLCCLVVERAIPPFEGHRALPGGFVLEDESLAEAAVRELSEETSLSISRVHLEQLASYGDPRRDPRGRVVSVAYLALAPDLPTPAGGSDALTASFQSVEELTGIESTLAFDHARILEDGIVRARSKLEYTSLATAFCPVEFTIGELRRVYEVVWGTSIDPRNFHRKVTSTPGFVEPTTSRTTRDGGRPALLYRRGSASVLYPPMTRVA
jgi:8-oxo-dGTP diphosphatase